MNRPPPFLPPRSLERTTAASTLVLGGSMALVTVLACVLWLFGRAPGGWVVLGTLVSAALLALGTWLWRRRNVKDASPIEARYSFVVLIALPLVYTAARWLELDTLSSSRAILRLALLILYVSFGSWFFFRYVLPEIRRQ